VKHLLREKDLRVSSADCVEMESAALYAYAARDRDVLCLAHVTTPWP
jgi:purine-nucleoside phosphorylase